MVHVAAGTARGADDGNEVLRSDSSESTPAVLVLAHHGRPLVWNDEALRRLEDIAHGSGHELTGVRADNLMLSLLQLALTPSEAADVQRPDSAHQSAATGRCLRGRSGTRYIIRAMPAASSTGEGAVALVTIDQVSDAVSVPCADPLDALTPREREVASLAARGDSTKAIAQSLGLSRHTVQEHLTNACCRLNVRGRRELIATLFVDLQRTASAVAPQGTTRTRPEPANEHPN